MGDSDKRSVAGVKREVEVATDIGMSAFNNLEVIFGG